MNFFEDQRIAKKKSNQLLFIFYVVVAGVSLLTTLLVGFFFIPSIRRKSEQYLSLSDLVINEFFTPEMLSKFGLIFGFVCITILIRSWWETYSLKSNPSEICRAMGAVVVKDNVKDPNIKMYKNIVEEMSLASSVPVPEIYILYDDAINAFACGYDINSAAICVTSGCIDKLSRDELQAVVAHEYSHILNGDMTINLKLIGMLAGLILIYQAGYHLLRGSSRRRSRDDKGGTLALGLGLMALGGLGFLGGLFLKSAISRQREYLADASSVQFTRNPSGIVGALKKIYLNTHQGILETAEANKVSHMFLVEGVKNWFNLSTHPDLFDRIKAVDKSFNMERFEREEIPRLKQEMKNPDRGESKKEKEKMDPKEQLQKIMPIFLMYQTQSSYSEMVIDLLKNEKKEIKELDFSQLEQVLEKVSGDLKAMSREEKDLLQKNIIQQINADGKIDFQEFLVYAYLKPTISPVEIKPHKLGSSEFKEKANELLSFFYYLDEIELTESHFSSINAVLPFQLISKEHLSYSRLLKTIEKLRFSSIDQREKLIRAMKVMAHLNGHINEREKALFSLIAQLLSVPGSVL